MKKMFNFVAQLMLFLVRGIHYLVFVTVFFFCFSSSFGQSSSLFDDLESSSSDEGKVRVIQDNAIKTLVDKHQWGKSKQHGIVGYRIRIFSNSGTAAKTGYDRAMAQFAYSYDYIPVYPKFVYPNYKIYVGDFRTESEALKFRKQIEHQFPGAFLVQTKINFPKLELNE